MRFIAAKVLDLIPEFIIEHRASNLVHRIRAISSAVERILHTDEAIGSRPISPTNDMDKFS